MQKAANTAAEQNEAIRRKTFEKWQHIKTRAQQRSLQAKERDMIDKLNQATSASEPKMMDDILAPDYEESKLDFD